MCSSADALPFPQAPQDHSHRHTAHTGWAPHPASTTAAASAPLQAGLRPPVPAVTAYPGSVDEHEQPSFQQDDMLGAAGPDIDNEHTLSW